MESALTMARERGSKTKHARIETMLARFNTNLARVEMMLALLPW